MVPASLHATRLCPEEGHAPLCIHLCLYAAPFSSSPLATSLTVLQRRGWKLSSARVVVPSLFVVLMWVMIESSLQAGNGELFLVIYSILDTCHVADRVSSCSVTPARGDLLLRFAGVLGRHVVLFVDTLSAGFDPSSSSSGWQLHSHCLLATRECCDRRSDVIRRQQQ